MTQAKNSSTVLATLRMTVLEVDNHDSTNLEIARYVAVCVSRA